MWQGVSGLSGLEGIVSPAYTVCIPSTRIDARFAAHLFKFPSVIHLFRRYSQGLVDDTLSLKFPTFSQIKISLPRMEEQKWISSVLSNLDREIELLERYRDALQKQKQGLMEKLLTGQIRLKRAHHD
jgi:type I restriction enzyme S subunit